MALADIPHTGQSRRLDSWKEIAEYLGRDVRTATRWEAQGMPLRRVPGPKGTSVFAFTNEIDEWMASRPDGDVSTALAGDALPVHRPKRLGLVWLVVASGLAIVVIGGAITAMLANPPLDVATLRVAATLSDVYVTDATGASRAVQRLKAGAQLISVAPVRLEDLDDDGTPEVLVVISNYDNHEDRSVRHGEVLNVSINGDVKWKFGFREVLSFASQRFGGPWAIVDMQVEPSASPPLVAVAAHDYVWWPGMVAVIDHSGKRLGTFVNPGWVESLLWLGSDRLAVGGFNNVRDGAMFAVLDARRADGKAPGAQGTPFDCVSCPSAAPLFYATFDRSELNRVTASRFNRARISVLGDRILVTTSETGREHGEANAIYEFDRALHFTGARYSDRYWDEHRRLELEGRVQHGREDCPDRDGPAAIHVWAGGAWQRVVLRR